MEKASPDIIPVDIALLQKSKRLSLTYPDGTTRHVSVATLRAHSPSADNQSSPRSEADFAELNITAIKPVGHYAVQLSFTDGHNTGIFSWTLLHQLSS
jgi:DUF971 family protein